MAQFTRTKKLTSYVYSPTDPASEDAIRLQVDNSIQEVADILYSQDVGKGASQVGINGLAYATVQDLAQVVSDSGTGTAPPALSVGNAQLATDVKVGSLALLDALLVGFTSSITVAINKIVAWIGNLTLLNTSDKTSLVNAINEVIGYVKRYTLVSDFTSSSATLTDLPALNFDVVAGKTYFITMVGVWKNAATNSGAKLGVYLKSGGAGTIAGYALDGESTPNQIRYQFSAIGASGLAGSFVTFSQPLAPNVFEMFDAKFMFVCSSSGNLTFQMSSENTDLMTLKSKTFVEYKEI